MRKPLYDPAMTSSVVTLYFVGKRVKCTISCKALYPYERETQSNAVGDYLRLGPSLIDFICLSAFTDSSSHHL